MNVNNYKAALLGLAVGDALGATTENMWTHQIQEQYGELRDIIGGGWLNLPAGHVTDDTEMTLAVAKGIIATKLDPKKQIVREIGKQFLKWEDTNPVDMGNITRMSFRFYRQRRNWYHAAKLADEYMRGNSAGNGSLMRCLPVALAYYNDPYLMEDITIKQSKMTHHDPKAARACTIYNRIARRIIKGEELKEAIKEEIRGTFYKSMLRRNPSNRPSGYVIDTFEWVLRTLLLSDSYEEVIVRLANLGSDSDTTSAIAGGLAGLYYGLDAIPERLSSKIIRREEILKTAETLYELSVRSEVVQ